MPRKFPKVPKDKKTGVPKKYVAGSKSPSKKAAEIKRTAKAYKQGKPIDIKMGPNWDDDLGGSQIYAANDPNLEGLTEQQRLQLSSVERLVFFYLPRICNHCLNPCCVASCPSGALYKRGEDGIVLVDQNRCRAWRSCSGRRPTSAARTRRSSG